MVAARAARTDGCGAALHAFDDDIAGTGGAWYTPAELNDRLGSADVLFLHAATTGVTGSGPTLTCQVEHSAIGEDSAYGGSIDGIDGSPLLGLVRIKITLGALGLPMNVRRDKTDKTAGAVASSGARVRLQLVSVMIMSGFCSSACDGGAHGTEAVQNMRDASPGTASLEFMVKGSGPYCAITCCGSGPHIEIRDSLGSVLSGLTAYSSAFSCDTCERSQILPGDYSCARIAGATLRWDGSYYRFATCGAGTSCGERVYASPGRYTASLCVTPCDGGVDAGLQSCISSRAPACASIQFEFPSPTPAIGFVGQ